MKKELTIRDQVQSYEDSCVINQTEPLNIEALLAAGNTPRQIAGMKLESIAKALNEGIPIDIYNGKPRYYPVFVTNGSPSAFAFDYSNYVHSFANAGSGALFALHVRVNSDYFGTQFIELWKEYLS